VVSLDTSAVQTAQSNEQGNYQVPYLLARELALAAVVPRRQEDDP